MSDTKFTPGPWDYDTQTHAVWSPTGSVAKVHVRAEMSETRANGPMIAAAPDLYAACKAALVALNPYDMGQFSPYRDTSAILRAALAKANGA